MLQGFLNPSATVTTLKASPAGPGGCANVEVETVSVAPAMSPAAARMHTVAFMDGSFVERPRRFVQKNSASALPIFLSARTGVGVYLSPTARPEATECYREICIWARLTLRGHWARLGPKGEA